MTDAWVPILVAAVTAGPAYVAFLLKKVHHQVNGTDETLSRMVERNLVTVGRIEAKLDSHLIAHAST